MANVVGLPDYTAAQILADVSPTMEVVLATNPRTAWVPMGEARRGDETGKFKWTEFVNSEKGEVITLDYVAGVGAFQIGDSSGYQVGDQVYLEDNVDGTFRKSVFNVTAIPDGTHLTIAHNANSGTDTSITIANSGIVHRQSAIADNYKTTAADFAGMDEPTVENNIFQTFQQKLELGKKAQELARNNGVYGISDAQMEGIRQRLFDQSYEIYNQLMRGFRREEGTYGGAFGGLAEFVIGAGATGAGTNLVNAGGNALTEDDLNDLFEQMTNLGLEDGAPMVLLMSPTNTRLLSSLRNNVVAPNAFTQNDSYGGNVQTFLSELPGFGGATILLDNNMEDSTVYLMNTDAIEWVTKENSLEPMSSIIDATEPAQLGNRWVLRTELSLRINSAGRRNGAIVNITP